MNNGIKSGLSVGISVLASYGLLSIPWPDYNFSITEKLVIALLFVIATAVTKLAWFKEWDNDRRRA